MEEKEILSKVAETFTEKPKYSITIPIADPEIIEQKSRSFWDKVFRKPVPAIPEPETERTFTICPCKVGNMYRVAGRAVLLPDEIKEGTISESILPLINDHLMDVVYIVASAIQNNHLEPDPELVEFIERNFDAADLYECMLPALESVGMQSFLNSIALVKEITILKPKASPKDGSESIASHTPQ